MSKSLPSCIVEGSSEVDVSLSYFAISSNQIEPNDVSACDFHNIENSFPHTFLFTHRSAIPLSLVFTFVTIMKRLGFRAMPYPAGSTVVAIVSDRLVVDVYCREVTLLSHAVPINHGASSEVGTTVNLLIRVARNVSAGFEQPTVSRSPFTERAYVAKRCILGLFHPRPFLLFGQDSGYWDSLFEDVMPIEKELMISGFFPSENL